MSPRVSSFSLNTRLEVSEKLPQGYRTVFHGEIRRRRHRRRRRQ